MPKVSFGLVVRRIISNKFLMHSRWCEEQHSAAWRTGKVLPHKFSSSWIPLPLYFLLRLNPSDQRTMRLSFGVFWGRKVGTPVNLVRKERGRTPCCTHFMELSKPSCGNRWDNHQAATAFLESACAVLCHISNNKVVFTCQRKEQKTSDQKPSLRICPLEAISEKSLTNSSHRQWSGDVAWVFWNICIQIYLD